MQYRLGSGQFGRVGMTQIQRLAPSIGQRRTASSEYARVHRSWARHRVELIGVEISGRPDGGQLRYVAGLRNCRLPQTYAIGAIPSPVDLAPLRISSDDELSGVCSSKLGRQYVETADAAQLKLQHVAKHSCGGDADPQTGEGPGTQADDQLAKIVRPYARLVKTV